MFIIENVLQRGFVHNDVYNSPVKRKSRPSMNNGVQQPMIKFWVEISDRKQRKNCCAIIGKQVSSS